MIPMKETFQTHVFNVNPENSRAFSVFPIFVLVLYCELNIDFDAFFLTSFLLKLVRVRVEHEKIKVMSTSGHVIFCLLYKHTNNDVIDDFPMISDHFPKISEDFVSEHFSTVFRRLSNISKEGPIIGFYHSATHLSIFLEIM